jgi:hypothetical protein
MAGTAHVEAEYAEYHRGRVNRVVVLTFIATGGFFFHIFVITTNSAFKDVEHGNGRNHQLDHQQ